MAINIEGEIMKQLLIIALSILLCMPAFGAINVTTNGDNRTITLQYTATASRVNTTLEKAAQFFYERLGINNIAGVPFSELTNAQKLSIVDKGVRLYLILSARENHVIEALETARESAESEDILIEEE
jgi:hypothetical protein